MNSAWFQIAANALANASNTPITENMIRRILATGDGPGHLVRALFGDCSADVLIRLARDCEISSGDLEAAYVRAKETHKAANAEFDSR